MWTLAALAALSLAARAVPSAHAPSRPTRHQPCRLAAPTLADLKVYELKAVCRAKGLKVSGRKAELIARIEAAPRGVTPVAPSRARGAPPRRASSSSPDAEAAGADTSGTAAARGAPIGESRRAAAATEVDVVDDAEMERSELASRRASRRAQRREKLAGYFSEEYSKLVGDLQADAGPAFSRAFGVEEVSIGAGAALIQIGRGGATRQYQESVHSRGRCLAWCKSFDAPRGCGVLIDLASGDEIAVRRAHLSTSPSVPQHARVLYPGEFIEYDPRLTSAADSADTPAAERGLVSGLLEWPLMCESVARAGLVLVGTD
ncbi:hypothetical protein AB1Y20_000751 [Prymnesium parvum]|uniref:SAP domain-containing protein n=1 Tax=Prymnesium parvum TaxID=97485 RepID=A0AB34K7J8_PRYPA